MNTQIGGDIGGDIGRIDTKVVENEFNNFIQPKQTYSFIQPKQNDKYFCNVVLNDKQYFTNSKNTNEESNLDYLSAVSNIWLFKITHLLLCISCFCFIILFSSTIYSHKMSLIVLGILSVLFCILASISRIYHNSYLDSLPDLLTNDCVPNNTLIDPFIHKNKSKSFKTVDDIKSFEPTLPVLF